MSQRPCLGEFRIPFTGNDLKGPRFFSFCLLLCLANLSGVYIAGNLSSGLIPALPSIKERIFWIWPQGKLLFFVVEIVFEIPQFAA